MEALENLVKTRQLQPEEPDLAEISGMIEAARLQFQDSRLVALSLESRFTLAYNASHALARAALRLHGYRSEYRNIVFQCLVHTAGATRADVQVLGECHRRRNLAEYEGYVEVDDQLFSELSAIVERLMQAVQNLATLR